ncbi:hypothetical protein G5B37_09455 [Rasiella rasia]|uniref:Uncharacterized protein n=1 Tax=Rasiella rasia TaxID=2744027 RepID=A0A6G6GMR2_9FLAO|nr:hypothetical protein [Rasiella rasia]QIE59780.1 hypothetical protein G5B37_09455 [Rasiella rasia]
MPIEIRELLRKARIEEPSAPISEEIDVIRPNNRFLEDVNRCSPDLTHYIVVKARNTLPRLCHDIHKNRCFYTEVTKHTMIANFRNLTSGTNLYMPPIK